MRWNKLAAATWVVLICAVMPRSFAFVHPGLLSGTDDLELMKEKVLAGVEPWKSGWDRMKNENDYLNHKPQPVADMQNTGGADEEGRTDEHLPYRHRHQG